MLIAAASPRVGWADPCAGWNAGYGLVEATGHESAAITHSWSAVTDCTTFSFNHYRACYYQDAGAPPASPPTNPGASGAKCVTLSTNISTTSFTEFTHRSDRGYNAKIFACQNSSCTQYYGSGSTGAPGTVSNVTDTATTDLERWVLEDVEDFDDPDKVIEDDDSAGGPGALFYPDGWTAENTLALWYVTFEDGGLVLKYTQAEDFGWHDFNTADFYEPVEVAGASDSGDFFGVTNPWVVAATDGENEFIRMFFHTGTGSNLEIWAIDSTDEFGVEFDLECTSSPTCAVSGSGTCDYGDLCDWDGSGAEQQLCIDTADPACFYLATAGHGRLLWDYVPSPGVIDFSEDLPGMLFTGDNQNSPCTFGVIADDIYQAEWSHDTAEPDGGDWSVDYAEDPDCPLYDPVFEDGHDPAVIPLPNGGFKAYFMHAGETQQHRVCYSVDGTSWGDCADIEFAFDDSTLLGTTSPDPMPCLGDMEALVFIGGEGVHEGGFLQASSGDVDPCNDAGGPFAEGGIVYVEHRN